MFKKYSINEQFFDQIGNVQCYYAGLLAADGNIIKYNNRTRVSIGLASKDRQYLETFKNVVKYTGPIREYTQTRDYTQILLGKIFYISKLVFSSVPTWIKQLENIYNITPNKTFTLEPPNLIKKEHIFSYLAGYIDGDGYVINTKYGIRIGVLGTKNLLEWFKNKCDLFFPINLNSNVCLEKNIYRFRINGKKATELQDYIFTLGIPLLTRKWCKI